MAFAIPFFMVALLLALGAAGAPEEVGTDAGVGDAGGDVAAEAAADPATDAAADIAEAVASARDELASLLAFAAGELGPLRSADLFGVDLRSDGAVKVRLAELDKKIARARREAEEIELPALEVADAGEDGGAPDEADAGPADTLAHWLFEGDATVDVLTLLRLRVREEEHRILSLPRERREELLAAEDDAIRAEAARRETDAVEREAAEAEQARLKALQAAQEARTSVEKQLAEVRARAEAARGEQLRARARLTERERALDSAGRERRATLAEVERRVASATPRSPEADALYDEIVEVLVDLREKASALLREIESAARAPRPEGDLRLPDTTDGELRSERDRLREVLDGLERTAASLETEERSIVWSALQSTMATERRANDLRILLLETVTPAKRDRVLGFGAEGRAQGAREIGRIRLELRWLKAAGGEQLRDTISTLKRPSEIARISVQLLALLGLVWATVIIRRRHALWLRWTRGLAARSIRRTSVLRLIQRSTLAVEAVGREAITLVAVLLATAIPWLDMRSGPVAVLYALFLWYWIYRLALTFTHRGLAWAAGRGAVAARADISDKILRSVRLVGRAAFFVAVLLASSAAVVGRGYLHGLVLRTSWLLAIAIGALLVRRWREDIANAYLVIRPSGALSDLVSKTRKRWSGFFVVIAAFGFVVASGLVQSLRRSVLEFEQSRKALAYLFRRRLEKKVEHAPAERPMLAPSLLAFFAEGPIDDEALSIERYPGLDELGERVAAWREGERIGATLVVGRTGYGKTSWLAAARARLAGLDTRSLSPQDRTTTERQTVELLARALDAPDGTRDADALIRFLRGAGRKAVLIDEAHLFFLRGVGQLEGWRALMRIIERTSDVVLWIVAFAHYPWELLDWSTKSEHAFRSIVRLAPWSEAEIAKLLRHRTEESGLTIAYDDLLVEGLGGDASSQILTTARDYDRLIWDYAEGSPRVALHVWGRSLVPGGPGHARVRLFASPDTTILEALGEPAKFILAAIVWHERLSIEEAAAVARVSPTSCEIALQRFLEHGVVEPAESRLRITPRWWPVVIRYLRRKHLIET